MRGIAVTGVQEGDLGDGIEATGTEGDGGECEGWNVMLVLSFYRRGWQPSWRGESGSHCGGCILLDGDAMARGNDKE